MRTTGWVLLEGTQRPHVAGAGTLAKGPTANDSEGALLGLITSMRPDVVAIDAPLTLPPCMSCPAFCLGPGSGVCELRSAQQVWDAGGHPVTERLTEVRLRAELASGPLPTMRIAQIAARGVALARRLRAGQSVLHPGGGMQILEVYPYATQARLAHQDPALGPGRSGEDQQALAARVLAALGVRIDNIEGNADLIAGTHVLDGLLSAYTGWLYPSDVEAPPQDFNPAAGWIWLPRIASPM